MSTLDNLRKHAKRWLKALRDGTSPKNLKGIASAELTGRAMRETETKARSAAFLGLKK